MPQQPTQITQATQGNDTISINPNINKIDPDFQRLAFDADPMLIDFYTAFCGWYKVTRPVEVDKIGGKKIKYVEEWKIDKVNRIMNEHCAGHIFGTIKPLLGPQATTGNMSDIEIFTKWDGISDAINFSLNDNYYFQGNSFELKIEAIGVIMANIQSHSAVTSKAKDGKGFEQVTSTLVTNRIDRVGDQVKKSGEGAFSAIKAVLGSK